MNHRQVAIDDSNDVGRRALQGHAISRSIRRKVVGEIHRNASSFHGAVVGYWLLCGFGREAQVRFVAFAHMRVFYSSPNTLLIQTKDANARLAALHWSRPSRPTVRALNSTR